MRRTSRAPALRPSPQHPEANAEFAAPHDFAALAQHGGAASHLLGGRAQSTAAASVLAPASAAASVLAPASAAAPAPASAAAASASGSSSPEAPWGPAAGFGASELPGLLIRLLKTVIYRDDDERTWSELLRRQSAVRDFMGQLHLELAIDEAEGYAFLRSREDGPEEPERKIPRLIARRPLSFPVSLLLALLRKRLAEFDAIGGDTRLIVSRDDIVELLRIFLPEGPNEARMIDQIESHVQRVVELGFLRKLKPGSDASSAAAHFEVRRILKAFVDAQWLAEFDVQLARYRAVLSDGADTPVAHNGAPAGAGAPAAAHDEPGGGDPRHA